VRKLGKGDVSKFSLCSGRTNGMENGVRERL